MIDSKEMPIKHEQQVIEVAITWSPDGHSTPVPPIVSEISREKQRRRDQPEINILLLNKESIFL